MRLDNMNLEKLFHMLSDLDNRKTTKILNLDGGLNSIRNQVSRIKIRGELTETLSAQINN